jgi:hypothetical protein
MKHMVIPDTQVKPGCPIDHLKWAGQYAVDKKPDVIVHIGDHWDMPSLSHYDKGTKSFEGRRYTQDIAAGIAGMEEFLAPIRAEQRRLKVNKHKQWNPRLVFTLGNHENRITRAIESDPKLDGLIGFIDFRLEEMGWEVVPFLAPIKIDGVVYAHYFTSGIMGRPVSSSRALLTKQFQSCVMGHVQDREISFAKRADGTRVTGLFSGIFYQHEEGYLNAQTNLSWRGIWMLHEVEDGAFDEMPVSLNYLRKRYG